MDTMLAYLLSFWGVISHIVSWAGEHPDAAGFYLLLINLVIAKVPRFGGYGKDALDIFGKAIAGAASRKGVSLKVFAVAILCIGLGVILQACTTTKNADGTTVTSLNATAQFAVDTLAQDVGYYGYKLVPEARVSLSALCALTGDSSIAMQAQIQEILNQIWVEADTEVGQSVCRKINQIAKQIKKAAAANLPDVEFLSFLRNLVAQVCAGVSDAQGKASAGYVVYGWAFVNLGPPILWREPSLVVVTFVA